MKNLIKNVQSFIPDGVDGALITDTISLNYLTDLIGIEGYIFITKNSAVLYTDGRYIEAAQKKISHLDVALIKRGVGICETAENMGLRTILCEGSISASRFDTLNKSHVLEFILSGEFDAKLLNLRSVKSDREIVRMRQAQSITDSAFEHIINMNLVGVSEKRIAAEIEYFMRKSGADSTAFDTIAVSGKNSSLPHGIPSDKPIEKGDFITLDFGASVEGCKSDMTRTIAVGFATEQMKEVYFTVLQAQENALSIIKAGASSKDVDAAARNYIAERGFGEYFTHSTGHGVGFEIHEAPNLSPASTAILRTGNVVTVEPGIYIPDTFGVRIEDYGMVTKDGFDNFTTSPKDLLII